MVNIMLCLHQYQRRLEPEAKLEAILLTQHARSWELCLKINVNLQCIVRTISLSLNTFI